MGLRPAGENCVTRLRRVRERSSRALASDYSTLSDARKHCLQTPRSRRKLQRDATKVVADVVPAAYRKPWDSDLPRKLRYPHPGCGRGLEARSMHTNHHLCARGKIAQTLVGQGFAAIWATSTERGSVIVGCLSTTYTGPV